MNSNFNQYLTKLNQEIDAFPFGENPKELYEPIRYILSLGGKKLRPMLALMAYKLTKSDWESIVRPAAAVEVFHNFTLMHDDIMDNAPIRRGHATVHEKWNTNIAILSGDTMLVRAYDMLLEINPSILPQVLHRFNKCAVEVCEGQQIDMNFESRTSVSVEEYIEMIRLKTAVLLGFSLELGGMLGGLEKSNISLLYDCGINLGIGFQLKDDLLDVFGDKIKFGKQVGGDILSNKKTFLLITALDIATDEQRKKLDYWLTAVDYDNNQKVAEVTQVFQELNLETLANQKINQYFEKCHIALNHLSVDEIKKTELKEFMDYLINREN
jgi:geranylgeranyl diphosphate synthase type II